MKYYMCDESEYVFTLDDFKTMLVDEEEEEMKIEEVERDYGGNMWCRRGERVSGAGEVGFRIEDGEIKDEVDAALGQVPKAKVPENFTKDTMKKITDEEEVE